MAGLSALKVKVAVFQDTYCEPFVYSFSALFDQWPGIDVLLERIFESGNVGALRDRLKVSMSTGDLVYISIPDLGFSQTYECASSGWAAV